MVSSILWLVQIASLSVTFSVFARRLHTRCNAANLETVSSCPVVFFGVLCAGLPTGNRVVLSFCQHMNIRLNNFVEELKPKKTK